MSHIARILVALSIATTAACLDTEDYPETAEYSPAAGEGFNGVTPEVNHHPRVTVRPYDGELATDNANPIAWVRPYDGEVPDTVAQRVLPKHDSGDWEQVSDADLEIEHSMCKCDTDECTKAWIEDNFGCGLCLHVSCGGGETAAGCVPCAP